MTRPLLKSFACIAAILVMFATTSCDTILQYPDKEVINPDIPEGKVLLLLNAELKYDLFGEFEYDFESSANPIKPRDPSTRNDFDGHCFRYKINAYDAADKSETPSLKHSYTYTAQPSASIDESVELDLDPGSYRIVVWADYVDEGSGNDKYYDTSEFSEITLVSTDPHSGSNIYRDAFYGETSISVKPDSHETTTVRVNLTRPMAKYTFVSTDLDEFLDMERSRNSAPGSDPDRAPAMSDYSVRIVYTQYMPCAFNAHTGKPADSKTGIEFRSGISVMEAGRAQLAFDHVFTNGSETSIAVAMEVIHRDGTIVARMPQFNVPIKRSHHTIVTGKFLTTKSGGEIGVTPDFDGDFNIFFQ